MDQITDPLELLKHIQSIFPKTVYLAEDQDGGCYVFEQQPILGFGCWIIVDREPNNFFFVSPILSRVLVWEDEHWTNRIITNI